jgi:lysophospholipase L1-like esterase
MYSKTISNSMRTGLLAAIATVLCGGTILSVHSGSGSAMAERNKRLDAHNDSLAARIDTMRSIIPFVVDSLCIVDDPKHSLDAFFAGLDSLSVGRDTVLTVVHLGDSHVQAGYYSGRVMRLLQQHFGNAGRGWISPLRISRTNEPGDYFISTVIKDWTTGRSTQSKPRCPVGPGGIGIQTSAPFVNFDLSMTPLNGAGYGFNQVIVYRGDKSMPMLPSGIIRQTARMREGIHSTELRMVADTILLASLTDSLQLQSTRRRRGTDLLLPAESFTNLYYGFSLTNGKPGVLYHSLGINGAMFKHYTNERYIRQLASLQPSLLILSLGTNESFAGQFRAIAFANKVEDFLALVKKYMPNTTILLTTPPEGYKLIRAGNRRAYVRNEIIERISQTIVQTAQQQGIACWDFFAATGGRRSAEKWFDGKWMARDRVHFNKEAYSEHGLLLFKALMNLKKQNDSRHEREDRHQ